MDSCCNHTTDVTILTPQRRFGYTAAFMGTLHQTINPECECTQMFCGKTPLDFNIAKISEFDRLTTQALCHKHNCSFYIHCPLKANLANPHCLADCAAVSKELNIINGLPGACVLHIGKKLKGGTIHNVYTNVNELVASINSELRYPMLLEVAAGQGTEIGYSWEELRHLYEGLDSKKVGLCIDTQHVFASGMCQFENHEDVVKLWDGVDDICRQGISLLHLNDSQKAFGSRVDRHAPLGQGFIWNKSRESLKSLIHIATDYGLDMISETKDFVNDLMVLNDL